MRVLARGAQFVELGGGFLNFLFWDELVHELPARSTFPPSSALGSIAASPLGSSIRLLIFHERGGHPRKNSPGELEVERCIAWSASIYCRGPRRWGYR